MARAKKKNTMDYVTSAAVAVLMQYMAGARPAQSGGVIVL